MVHMGRLKQRHVIYLEPELSAKLLERSRKASIAPTEIVRQALRKFLKVKK
jgi:hypothetical protein